MTVIARCGVCHEQIFAAPEGEKYIACTVCEMIAEGRLFKNGKDPAEGLTSGDIAHIKMRVASIQHWQENKTEILSRITVRQSAGEKRSTRSPA